MLTKKSPIKGVSKMAKTILITGATSGFGKATAKKFAAENWQLILTGRRVERLAKLQSELGNKVRQIIPLDVRDRQQVFDQLGGLENIDLLLNNAGLALGLEPAWDVNIDDWDTMVDTNIKGLMYCTRAILPKMVGRNSGHIINISSTAGSWPYPGGNAYGSTKAFVDQFSRNLRADLLGKKCASATSHREWLRVNSPTCVSKGMIPKRTRSTKTPNRCARRILQKWSGGLPTCRHTSTSTQ